MIVKRDKGGGGSPYINGNNCSHIHAYKHKICGGFPFVCTLHNSHPHTGTLHPYFQRGMSPKTIGISHICCTNI